jgi:hypothetical protein
MSTVNAPVKPSLEYYDDEKTSEEMIKNVEKMLL